MSDSKKQEADKIYDDARALCYGAAARAVAPYTDFTFRERSIIDEVSLWMGSRDCQIVKLGASLEACRDLVDRFERKATSKQSLSCSYTEAKRAIAKAEGRSHE